VAHNGTLVNTSKLKAILLENGIPLRSSSDSEMAAKLIGHFTQQTNRMRDGIKKTMELIEGAYSMVLITDRALYAFRDPHGVRPLCVGKIPDVESNPDPATTADSNPNPANPANPKTTANSNIENLDYSSPSGWVVSSETCGLDIVGAEFVCDVKPGEVIKISDKGFHAEQAVPERTRAFCIFEYIYFARPDSILDNAGVYRAREAMGRKLSQEAPVEADIVIGVPDSGIPSAIGYARQSGIVYSEGLIKNRYVGRTFIAPTQLLRQMGIRTKLNPLPYTLRNRRVIVVDDSIVRGNTSKQLVKMLRDAGAKEVHMRVVSPPVAWPCFYGIDTDVQEQLIAANMTVDEIRDFINVDSLAYISTEGLRSCIYAETPGYCDACFSGEYPVRLPQKMVETCFKEDISPTFWMQELEGMSPLWEE
jgi:amidophosphoribosyltransferase